MKLTKAQLDFLRWVSERPQQATFIDWAYAYPRRHAEALEEAGLVTIEGIFDRFVQLTDAGRDLVA